jgi:M6 family metalloprotease-like protein
MSMFGSKTIVLFILILLAAASGILTACQKSAPSDIKQGLHSTQAVGDRRYVVVMADFPDVKRQYPENTMSDRMIGFLSSYFKASSYDKFNLKGDITGPYKLPNPVSYYKISPRNLEVDPNRVISLVTDVVNAAEKNVDLGSYNYILISLGGTQAEYGMVGYCAVPGMLGFQSKSAIKTKGGKSIDNAAVFCENAHLGTYVHDSLHMFGGYVDKQRMTPCLYDHDLQAKYTGGEDWSKVVVNMGFWDPLSSHAPYIKEMPPTGLSAWTKLRLNWIDSTKIGLVAAGQTATFKLDPLADRNASTLVVKIPVSDSQYYLVENRQKIDSDANCSTTGILITYCDDTVYECRQGKAPVRIMDADTSTPYFNNATFDIGKKDKYIDAKNNLAIVLQQKIGQSYQILVTTADKAGK